jgi:hypothetical protein
MEDALGATGAMLSRPNFRALVLLAPAAKACLPRGDVMLSRRESLDHEPWHFGRESMAPVAGTRIPANAATSRDLLNWLLAWLTSESLP